MPRLDEDCGMQNEELMEINTVGKDDDRQVSVVHAKARMSMILQLNVG